MKKILKSTLYISAIADHSPAGGEIKPDQLTLIVKVLFLVVAAWLTSGIAVKLIGGAIPALPSPPLATESKNEVMPQAVAARQLAYYSPVWEKNPFNPEGTVSQQEATIEDVTVEEVAAIEEAKPVENIPLSSLNYKLVGTITGIPVYSFAIIKAPNQKEQSLYRIGDMVGPAKIIRIERNRVVVNNAGREEMLEVKFDEASALDARVSSSAKGIKKVAADRFILDKKEVDRLSGNVSQFMTQVRIIPNMVRGKGSGYKLLNIKRGSLVESIGLKNGDIVKEINGRSIDKPEEAFVAYQQLKDGGSFSIELERRGKRETIHYEIR